MAKFALAIERTVTYEGMAYVEAEDEYEAREKYFDGDDDVVFDKVLCWDEIGCEDTLTCVYRD